MPEAMFAHAVILVEGITDKGALEGCGQRDDKLNRSGVMVVSVKGKQNLHLPYAILTELGIPTFLVFDGDASVQGQQPDAKDVDGSNLKNKIKQAADRNRSLLALLGEEPVDWPETKVTAAYAVFQDTLEVFLTERWQEWVNTKKQLVENGECTDGKSEHTYRQAALKAADPPDQLLKIIAQARLMAKQN
ncbi:ATP-dependent endonuclease [Actinomadura sp. CNU-125]|uniref:ATP-dependent endonuclease n=1 Tax=Actinomadura sp. CNU-125 TaxID=1904961 RepID=UPI0009FA24D7|nr:ATP-dependent endonuclease [Actinomadura sp. CNU-125]